MRKRLHFHVLTSEVFSVGAPLVSKEILSRGHELSIYLDSDNSTFDRLLACDVYIDMSAITELTFYENLKEAIEERKLTNKPTPLLVDPPSAVMCSIDKRKTHALFPKLIPESYSLDGINNADIFAKFQNDQYVIVKDPFGWGGTGVSRLSPDVAKKKYKSSSNLIAQRYIPPREGVGRIVTVNHADDFVIAASYARYSEGWRTGIDVEYECIPVEVTSNLAEFARSIAVTSGLYLNGIDYIKDHDRLYLLEVNAVPAMGEVMDTLGIDIPSILLDHIERNT